MQDKYIILLLNTSPFICLFSKYGLNCCFHFSGTELLKSKGGHPPTFEKKISTSMYISKKNFNSSS